MTTSSDPVNEGYIVPGSLFNEPMRVETVPMMVPQDEAPYGRKKS
jgi:hypothetical protein